MFILLSIISIAIAIQPVPVSAKPSSTANPTLSSLPVAARPLASQRARFVYRLPDSSVWDSFYYLEFRKVLDDFDSLPKGTPMPAPEAAWGFSSSHRGPASAEKRPSPLWHTLQPPASNPHLTPFIYINTAAQSSKRSANSPVLKIGTESEPSVFSFTFTEYPGDQNAFVNLPCSINLGYATGLVRLPSTLHPSSDGTLSGEFFLVADDTEPKLSKPDPTRRVFKLVHAQDLRLTPDQYAGELIARRAEMVQWTFKRTTTRVGDTYTWARSAVEIPAPAPQTPSP